MNRPLILLLTLGGIAGCGSDGVTPTDAAGTRTTPGQQISQKAAPRGQTQATAAKAAAVIPQGARFTIYIAAFSGGGHEQQAKLEKDRLSRAVGRKDFWVIHKPESSELYMGYYRAMGDNVPKADAAEAKRAETDLKAIKSIIVEGGGHPYARSLLIPIPTPDPAAPAEWNLVNVDRDRPLNDPDRRYWSVAVAAYTNDARGQGNELGMDRKQLAVESVAAARKAGIEAYYYHGENVSTVSIGAFPRKAVQSQAENNANPNDPNAGRRAMGRDDRTDIVVSTAPLPDGMASAMERQHNVEVFQPKLEILDPNLLRVMAQYPTYAVNGQEQTNVVNDPRTGHQMVRTQPSFLVEIPAIQPSLVVGTPTNDAPPPPTLINPMGPTSGGQLRGLNR
jgi:hypothetical protein